MRAQPTGWAIRMKWSDRFEMIYRLRFKHHFSRRESRATSNCVDSSDSAAFDSIVELPRGRVPIEQVASVIDINRSPVSRFVFIFVFVWAVFISVDSRVPVELSWVRFLCGGYCFVSNCADRCTVQYWWSEVVLCLRVNLRSRTRSFETCGREEIWRSNRLARLK